MRMWKAISSSSSTWACANKADPKADLQELQSSIAEVQASVRDINAKSRVVTGSNNTMYTVLEDVGRLCKYCSLRCPQEPDVGSGFRVSDSGQPLNSDACDRSSAELKVVREAMSHACLVLDDAEELKSLCAQRSTRQE